MSWCRGWRRGDWRRGGLRRAWGAAGFRRCPAPHAAGETDTAGNGAAQGAADPAEEARTHPLGGLGRKARGVECGLHWAYLIHKLRSYVKLIRYFRQDFFLLDRPASLPPPGARADQGEELGEGTRSRGKRMRGWTAGPSQAGQPQRRGFRRQANRLRLPGFFPGYRRPCPPPRAPAGAGIGGARTRSPRFGPAALNTSPPHGVCLRTAEPRAAE